MLSKDLFDANTAVPFRDTWNEIAKIIHNMAVDKGFWEGERNDGEMIALIHSELSEGLEALREHISEDDKIPEFSGIEAELADTVIRIMDMAHARGWDVAKALLAKVNYNARRDYKHGGKEF